MTICSKNKCLYLFLFVKHILLFRMEKYLSFLKQSLYFWAFSLKHLLHVLFFKNNFIFCNIFSPRFIDHSSAGQSPIKSVDHKRTDGVDDHQVKSQQLQEELELRRQRRRAPILLDSRALERAMSQRHDSNLI